MSKMPYIIEESILQLSEDVTNPNPDLRCKNDWRKLAVWPNGMRFIVRKVDVNKEFSLEDTRPSLIVRVLHPSERFGVNYSIYEQGKDKIYFDLIVPHLVPVPVSVRSLMEADDLHSNELYGTLQWLVKHGKLTLDDVKAALDRDEAEDGA